MVAGQTLRRGNRDHGAYAPYPADPARPRPGALRPPGRILTVLSRSIPGREWGADAGTQRYGRGTIHQDNRHTAPAPFHPGADPGPAPGSEGAPGGSFYRGWDWRRGPDRDATRACCPGGRGARVSWSRTAPVPPVHGRDGPGPADCYPRPCRPGGGDAHPHRGPRPGRALPRRGSARGAPGGVRAAPYDARDLQRHPIGAPGGPEGATRPRGLARRAQPVNRPIGGPARGLPGPSPGLRRDGGCTDGGTRNGFGRSDPRVG
ncbi:hypothetical protein DSECCO2_575700 [anaerobic digester metagenome]